MPRRKALGPQIALTATALDDRAKALSIRAKQRKRIALNIRLDDYEPVLAMAERWGDDLDVVIRACFLFGLDHYRTFASNNAEYSPFTRGHFNMPRPSQLDPSGLAFPPPPQSVVFGAPVQPHRTPHELAWGNTFQPPPSRTVVSEITEPVFARVGQRDVPIAGLLPSGGAVEQPNPPSPPMDLGAPQEPLPFDDDAGVPTLTDDPAQSA